MTDVQALIEIVERAGGKFMVDRDRLGIIPKAAGEQLVEGLRRHKQEIIAAILERDAAVWRRPFEQWLNSACSRRPRDFGGLNCLFASFCAWVGEQGGATVGRDTFEWMLAEHDFLIGEVCGVVLVSGLMLAEDVLAHLAFQREALP